MSGYADWHAEATEKYEARKRLRRRVLSTLRGWLLEHGHPRRAIFCCLLASFVPGALVTQLLVTMGISAWGPAPATGLLVSWPAFVYFLALSTKSLSQRMQLNADWNWLMARDQDDQGRNLQARFELPERYEHAIGSGLRAGSQQAVPGMGGIGLLVIGLLTVGTFLIWDLTRQGVNLSSEAILDAHWGSGHPWVRSHIDTENYWSNMLIATALHFWGLAIVACLLGAVFFCLIHPASNHL